MCVRGLHFSPKEKKKKEKKKTNGSKITATDHSPRTVGRPRVSGSGEDATRMPPDRRRGAAVVDGRSWIVSLRTPR